MESRKQPSKEEILAQTRKAPLRKWCDDFDVLWKMPYSIARLQMLLSNALSDVSDGPEEKNEGGIPDDLQNKTDKINNDNDRAIKPEDSSIPNETHKEVETAAETSETVEEEPERKGRYTITSNVSKETAITEGLFSKGNQENEPPSRLILPVSMDELIHIWRQGYMIHPQLACQINSRFVDGYSSSEICFIEQIDLSKRYEVTTPYYLELDQKVLGLQFKLGYDEFVANDCILKIIVEQPNQVDEVKVALRNTFRGFKEDQVLIDVETLPKTEPVIPSSNQTELIKQSCQSEVDSIRKLDALMGGIAISGYMERFYFAECKNSIQSMNYFGSFYDGIFNQEKLKSNNEQLFVIIHERVLMLLNDAASNTNDYINDNLALMLGQDLDQMKDLVFKRQEGPDSKTAPVVLNDIKSALAENFLKEAIKSYSITTVRDPFLLFICFLNQYPNTMNRAASDKQSFLMALFECEAENLVTKEEVKIISFLLGFSLGYGMCWNPDSATSKLEWEGNFDFLKVLYDEGRSSIVVDELTNCIKLKYRKKKNKKEICSTIETRVLRTNKNVEGRELSWSVDQIKLIDEDASLVEASLRSRRLEEELPFFDLRLRSGQKSLYYPIHIKTRAQQVHYDLLLGEYSQEERNFLKSLLRL